MAPPSRPVATVVASVAATVALATGLVACGTSTGGAAHGAGTLRVVAAENFWGSIAAQLGGDKVSVTSIISSPDTDPHDYEPRARDARAVASAAYVIVNGAGYDPWAAKLIAAAGGKGPTVLDVGKLVGVAHGGNPHRWYSPPDVAKVVGRIAADYARIDPAGAAAFAQQRATFESTGLGRYTTLVASIRQAYAGTAVGASESIVAPLADALGLTLLTPASFLDAVSEGTDPTAQDKATVDAQIRTRQIKVYVFNSQNATPDVKAEVKLAEANGVPVTSVTETLTPATASFQDWQVAQLESLSGALARATAGGP